MLFVAIALALVLVFVARYWLLAQVVKVIYLVTALAFGARKRRIDVMDGQTWHYLEAGSHEKPVLLLLHGFGVDKFVWLPYIKAMKEDYHIIAPDLPGFGDAYSQRVPVDYSVYGQVEALQKFVEHLDISSFHLAGNSMGGLISAMFCIACQNRVRTLVLMNAAGIASSRKSDLDVMFEKGELVLLPRTIEELDRLFAMIAVKPVRLPWIFKKHLLHEVASRYSILKKAFNEVMMFRINSPINEQLSKITIPTLVVWGRLDRILDVSAAETAARLLPDSQLKILDKAGHAPMVEAVAETADCHKTFIEQHF